MNVQIKIPNNNFFLFSKKNVLFYTYVLSFKYGCTLPLQNYKVNFSTNKITDPYLFSANVSCHIKVTFFVTGMVSTYYLWWGLCQV
jgi:hypothetical protein